MRRSGTPFPRVTSGRRDVDPELHAQRPAELQLLLERALGEDGGCVAGELRDLHAASLDSAPCAFADSTKQAPKTNGRRIRKLRLLALVLVLGLLWARLVHVRPDDRDREPAPAVRPRAPAEDRARRLHLRPARTTLLAVLRGKESRVILNARPDRADHEAGDRRDRGQALLRAQRRRPARDRPRAARRTSSTSPSSRAARRSRSSSSRTPTWRTTARSRAS